MTETRFSADTQHRYNPVKEKSDFWDNYLGLIIQLSLFVVLIVVTFISAPKFFDPKNWSGLFEKCVPNAIMALALVLTTRLKGIDLSAGAVFAIACWVFASYANEGMVVPGLVLALGVGLALGAVNGTIQMFIRVPSAVLTMIISAAVTFGISLLVSWCAKAFWDGKKIEMQTADMGISAVDIISLISALIIVLLFLYFSKLGAEGPVQKRHVFMSYTVSGMIFSLAACNTVMRQLAVTPIYNVSAKILFILFIAGAILVSRSAKIRIIPVVCALIAVLNFSIISDILVQLRVDYYSQRTLYLLLTAAIIIPAFIVQRGCRSRLITEAHIDR